MSCNNDGGPVGEGGTQLSATIQAGTNITAVYGYVVLYGSESLLEADLEPHTLIVCGYTLMALRPCTWHAALGLVRSRLAET